MSGTKEDCRMRLIDADELKKEFRARVPMAVVAFEIIDGARTITVMDEAPALIECNYKDINIG